MDDYQEFLAKKKITVEPCGFESTETNSVLFEWQTDIVKWALRKGKAGIFTGCGLGKTGCQLQWAKEVVDHTKKPVLVLAPLAVSQQTKREGVKFGIDVNICRTQEDVKDGINITNYEMMEHFDANQFSGVVLDEAGILKAYMGKTKRMLVEKFADTKYKLVCTATPSPNDQMELLNQAEYLGIMRSNEALAIWFIADQTQSGTYRLKKHAVKDFWDWVATWAVCFEKPSDIGYADDGFELPELREHDIIVDVDEIDHDCTNGFLRDIQTSATGFYVEKRHTLKARCAECKRIADEDNSQILIWCNTNEEADELKRLLPDALEVRGSDSREKKEQAAMDFVDGKVKALISKSSIFGYGLNFFQCCRACFCGMDYSYDGYYQAVRRLWRYGQTRPVDIYRVLGKTEKNILDTINRKQTLHDDMREGMKEAMLHIAEHGEKERYAAYKAENQKVSVPDWLRSEAI